MGINTHILLPAEARAEDVVQVMGILAGLKPKKHIADRTWWVEVPGAKIVPSSGQFGCAHVTIKPEDGQKLIDGETNHSCFMILSAHSGQQAGYNTKHGLWISTSVTPFWEAVAYGLARFFGGEVDRNDCDETDVDFAWPKASDLMACDGARSLSLPQCLPNRSRNLGRSRNDARKNPS